MKKINIPGHGDVEVPDWYQWYEQDYVQAAENELNRARDELDHAQQRIEQQLQSVLDARRDAYEAFYRKHQQPQESQTVCEWVWDDSDLEQWNTGCGRVMYEYGWRNIPIDVREQMKWCPFCGHPRRPK